VRQVGHFKNYTKTQGQQNIKKACICCQSEHDF